VSGFLVGFYLLYADSQCHAISAAPIKKIIVSSTTSPLRFRIKASTSLHLFRAAYEMEQFCTLAGIERHLHSFLSAMELHPLSEARIRSRGADEFRALLQRNVVPPG
jgi:hypothetical protein